MQKTVQPMKNFNENLQAQFEGLKIKPPEAAKNLTHLYADYIELVALFSNKVHVTKDEILRKIQRDGESSINDVISHEASGDEIEGDLFGDINTSRRNDIKERWGDDLFQVLEDRTKIFGDNYPFIYSTHTGLILKEKCKEKQKVYLFLLISSNLDLFNKVASDLTADFEEVSFFVLKNFLPSAEVRRFGKKTQYEGNAKEKIRTLAGEMKLEINEHNLENISDRNSQDRGLDVVAWIPFADNCPNIIAVLGQCACGRDWSKKYHDTQRFSTYMRYFRQKPIHAMFIPYSLISGNSDRFCCSDNIERNTMMFERKRMVELFNNPATFDALPSKQIVERCVEYFEDLV